MNERLRLWGLRLLALGLALFVWYFVSLEKRERPSERVIDATVTYLPPPGIMVLDPIQSVKVRLRGGDRRIRNLSPVQVDVVIELPTERVGKIEFHLGPENVLRPDDVDVVSIDPNTIRLEIDRQATRLVPGEPRLVGEPAAGAVPQQPTLDPAAVLVTGPESRLQQLAAVSTSPVRLDGHAFDIQETVMVLSPDSLVKIVEPVVVTVRVPLLRPDDAEATREPEPAAAPRRRR